jgi:hypothetical protein
MGGYLVNPSSIPLGLRWLRYLSPMSFALEVRLREQRAGGPARALSCLRFAPQTLNPRVGWVGRVCAGPLGVRGRTTN